MAMLMVTIVMTHVLSVVAVMMVHVRDSVCVFAASAIAAADDDANADDYDDDNIDSSDHCKSRAASPAPACPCRPQR